MLPYGKTALATRIEVAVETSGDLLTDFVDLRFLLRKALSEDHPYIEF